jgi:hypothetical protein
MIKSLNVEATGTKHLIMHNSRLANPLDKFAKELKKLSSQRTKTDDQIALMSKTEFFGSIYYSEKTGVFVPEDWVLSAVIKAAKRNKKGASAQIAITDISDQNKEMPSGVLKLFYNGPQTPEKMWLQEDQPHVFVKGVVVQRNRVMRTRVIIPEWKLKFRVNFDDEFINEEDLSNAVLQAGEIIGIGDWRPRYGRFEASFS